MKTTVVLVALIAVLGDRVVWAANDSALLPSPTITTTSDNTIAGALLNTTTASVVPIPNNGTTPANNAAPMPTSTQALQVGSGKSTVAAGQPNLFQVETSTHSGASVFASYLLSVIVGLSTVFYQRSV